MTIYKLTLTLKKGYRFEQTESSLHINKEVAEKFAKEKIDKGFEEIVEITEWGTCTRHVGYYEEYSLEEIFVNEG